MFGIRFIKSEPTTYLMAFKKGKIFRQGHGLSFLYFGPSTSLVAIPSQSTVVDFIDQPVTKDFQSVTVQGQVSYRISEPEKLARLLNFTLAANGKSYVSSDPEKLNDRIFGVVKVLVQSILKTLTLKEALLAAEDVAKVVETGLANQLEIQSLGVQILRSSIIAVKPSPETAKALEAEARELILRSADEAIFARRNNAVEQERAIRESELDTEVAVEVKKRAIEEAKLEAEASVSELRHELQRKEMVAAVTIENSRKDFVAANAENTRTLAEAEAQKIGAIVEVLRGLDPRLVQSIAAIGMEPSQLIAQAFTGLAENAGKIGQLNVSSELLESLIGQRQYNE